MHLLAIPAASVVVIALGLAIGATPFVNENLHWNIWFIVPISGVILGCLFGWIQFRVAFVMGAPVRKVATIVLAVAAALGYAATDAGTYATMKVEMTHPDGTPAGEKPLRELISFAEYMNVRLASSSITLRPGSSDSPTLDLGRWAATASFGVDLLGCLLGAFALLRMGSRGAPFCNRCNRYKARTGKIEAALAEDTMVEKMTEIHEAASRGEYALVVSRISELSKDTPPEKTPVKLVVDERVCPGCNEATLTARVWQRRGKEWKEIPQLGLRAHSGTGETARLPSRS
jgi:hypothetical protein